MVNYCGYGRDGANGGTLEDGEFDVDAVAHDWEAYGAELTAFWMSGKYTCTETLAPFGIDVKVPIHLWSCGGPGKVPWAATFCKPAARPARKTTKPAAKTSRKTAKRGPERTKSGPTRTKESGVT